MSAPASIPEQHGAQHPGVPAPKAQHGIRLFLADVDGALVTHDKVLSEAAKAAVRDLREAGIALAITSGRPPRGMRMLVEPLALTTPIAGFNGGMFVNPDLSVIESHTLDPAVAPQTVTLIGEQGLDVWVYTETEWLIRDPSAPHVAREAWTVKFDARVVPEFTDDHLSHAVKIVGISDDLARAAACEKAAQKVLGDRASAARSQPYYLDVTHPQANKGVVVTTLACAFTSSLALPIAIEKPLLRNISTSFGMSPMVAMRSRGMPSRRERVCTTVPLFAFGLVTSR